MADNITLKSKWASLTDYISADQYNKLVEDIVAVATLRGVDLEKRKYTGTVEETPGVPKPVQLNIIKPSLKKEGDDVRLADIEELQRYTKGTIMYPLDTLGMENPDPTMYPFHKPSELSKPMALLYNEVRQVVVDLYSNAGCVNCSEYCKAQCTAHCYTGCNDNCADSNCKGQCGQNCADHCYNSASCLSECGSAASVQAYGCSSGCSTLCHSNCDADACKSSCQDECSTNCAATCGTGCTFSCREDCGKDCTSSDCGNNCYVTCSVGCGSGCVGMVTGSSPMAPRTDFEDVDGYAPKPLVYSLTIRSGTMTTAHGDERSFVLDVPAGTKYGDLLDKYWDQIVEKTTKWNFGTPTGLNTLPDSGDINSVSSVEIISDADVYCNWKYTLIISTGSRVVDGNNNPYTRKVSIPAGTKWNELAALSSVDSALEEAAGELVEFGADFGMSAYNMTVSDEEYIDFNTVDEVIPNNAVLYLNWFSLGEVGE